MADFSDFTYILKQLIHVNNVPRRSNFNFTCCVVVDTLDDTVRALQVNSPKQIKKLMQKTLKAQAYWEFLQYVHPMKL